MKKIISLVTSLIITFSLLATFPVQMVFAEGIASQQSGVAANSSDYSIEGTSSFGTMLADAISAKEDEQLANNGYNVVSIEMEDNIAVVSFESIADCMLVVAIYDEAGEAMLASGSTAVTTDMTEVALEIETDSMPKYFYLRGFLVDSISFRPLCMSYESPIYTQEMQEFLAKTVDDFDSDKVLNLDDDKTNNFAVYSEETVIIENEGDVNTLVSSDNESLTYVFENANSEITSLRSGDIFVYEYGNSETLIVKVSSVTINDTKATIVGQHTSMEDVFDYVKIDVEAGNGDVTIDTSQPLEEGVTYTGIVDYPDSDVMTYAASGDGSVSSGFKFEISKKFGNDNASAKISGSLTLKVKTKIKYYISTTKQYFEFALESSAKLNFAISGKLQGDIPLFPLGISPVPGVYIDFTPKIHIEASVTASLSGEIKEVIGVKYLNGEFTNISKNPTFYPEFKIEGKIFIGLLIEPKIGIIKDEIFYGKISAKVGVELTASRNNEKNDENHKHTCDYCIDGDINGKLDISAEIKFFNWDKLKFNLDILEVKLKICDFYYSATYNEFGFGECPYNTYKVTIDTKYIEGAKIVITPDINNNDWQDYSGFTDHNGRFAIYLKNGEYSVIGSKDKLTASSTFKVNDDSILKTLLLQEPSIIEKPSAGGENAQINDNSRLSLGYFHSAYITSDNILYMWGSNFSGQLGDGTTTVKYTPVRIMDNVKDVSLGYDYSAAITNDGGLYTWGWNCIGQLGDGTTTDKYTPLKIMDDAKSVSLGYEHSAAITNDGELYTWGYNYYGQLGTATNKYTPVKIMDNVKSVSLKAYQSAAITNDDILYIWGYDDVKQLSDGTTTDKYTPVKIMDNVKLVSSGVSYFAAVTNDGSLYTWGDNWGGQLGDGTTTNRNSPTLITIPSTYSNLYYSNAQFATTVEMSEIDSFTELIPNMVYNVYAMQSRNAEYPLGADNLLYISQAVSDENGTINGNFIPVAKIENMEWFAIPMLQTDITGANITVEDLVYNGEEQYVEPTVVLDEVTLTKGDDYYLEQDYSAIETGEYTVIIRGTGLYTGSVSVTYKVIGENTDSSDTDTEVTDTETDTETDTDTNDYMEGDINKDGKISIVDVVMARAHIVKTKTLSSEQIAIGDMNKDNKISIVDVVMMRSKIVNG